MIMSTKGQQLIFLLLVATCAANLVQPGQAQQIPLFPGLIPPGAPGDVTQCWASLVDIQGCVWEIYRSVFSVQFGNVGPACCKAFLAVDAKCWSKMFPWNPFFPPLLKSGCARIAGAVPPAAK